MKKLDLREIGSILGCPLYVDLADVPDHKDKNELLSFRDQRELQITKILQKAFGMTKEQKQ